MYQNSNLFVASQHTLEMFKDVLTDLPAECYHQPCAAISNATIGQHTRHVIELYQCLVDGYDTADVCYDRRKRDRLIEQDPAFAIACLALIQRNLERPDKTLFVTYDLEGSPVRIASNYLREVMYNLEHAIHHHALIKVAIHQVADTFALPEAFGVAPSTLDYRRQCAQ
jgi:hypothetical protein